MPSLPDSLIYNRLRIYLGFVGFSNAENASARQGGMVRHVVPRDVLEKLPTVPVAAQLSSQQESSGGREIDFSWFAVGNFNT